MKKLTILLITILIIYLIYNIFKVNKINYVSLSSDNSFNNNIKELVNYNDYFNNNYLYNTYQDIKNNKTIKVGKNLYYLKKVLRESDVLVISIGMEELINCFDKYNMNNNYSCFNKMYTNISLLINEIKKYAYGKIIFLGYYNPTNYYDGNIDRFFYDVNIKLERLMINNDVIYIDLYELYKENKHDSSLNIKIGNIIMFYLK